MFSQKMLGALLLFLGFVTPSQANADDDQNNFYEWKRQRVVEVDDGTLTYRLYEGVGVAGLQTAKIIWDVKWDDLGGFYYGNYDAQNDDGTLVRETVAFTPDGAILYRGTETYFYDASGQVQEKPFAKTEEADEPEAGPIETIAPTTDEPKVEDPVAGATTVEEPKLTDDVAIEASSDEQKSEDPAAVDLPVSVSEAEAPKTDAPKAEEKPFTLACLESRDYGFECNLIETKDGCTVLEFTKGTCQEVCDKLVGATQANDAIAKGKGYNFYLSRLERRRCAKFE